MATVDVLGTVNLNTLTYMYKSSLIKFFFKGYHGMLPMGCPLERYRAI